MNFQWHCFISTCRIRSVTHQSCSKMFWSLRRHHLSTYGHVARLDAEVPANTALCLMVDLHTDGMKPEESWNRPPGRPRRTWLSHICEDNDVNPRSTWMSKDVRGHHRAVQQSTSMWWWWWWWWWYYNIICSCTCEIMIRPISAVICNLAPSNFCFAFYSFLMCIYL